MVRWISSSPTRRKRRSASESFARQAIPRRNTTEAQGPQAASGSRAADHLLKRGDLHARRHVLTVVTDKGVVHQLFTEIAPEFSERDGGYTRITKIGPRKGDNAAMAVIELVRGEPVAARPRRRTRRAAPEAPATATATGVAEAEADAEADEAAEVSAADTEVEDVEDVQNEVEDVEDVQNEVEDVEDVQNEVEDVEDVQNEVEDVEDVQNEVEDVEDVQDEMADEDDAEADGEDDEPAEDD